MVKVGQVTSLNKVRKGSDKSFGEKSLCIVALPFLPISLGHRCPRKDDITTVPQQARIAGSAGMPACHARVQEALPK